MIWQDGVLAVGSAGFALALLPTLHSPHRPEIKTSVLTAAILWAETVVYLTLGLPLTAILVGANAWLWTLLIRRSK